MNLGTIGAALALVAAATALSSCTGAQQGETTGTGTARWPMQIVAVGAQLGEPGHGWRYFSDESEGRAVVISPGGNYYYSEGRGPELVFKASEAA